MERANWIDVREVGPTRASSEDLDDAKCAQQVWTLRSAIQMQWEHTIMLLYAHATYSEIKQRLCCRLDRSSRPSSWMKPSCRWPPTAISNSMFSHSSTASYTYKLVYHREVDKHISSCPTLVFRQYKSSDVVATRDWLSLYLERWMQYSRRLSASDLGLQPLCEKRRTNIETTRLYKF